MNLIIKKCNVFSINIQIVKILSLCKNNDEMINTICFIENRYTELKENIKKYQNTDESEKNSYKWLYNKIVNDYETVNEFLTELMEILYKEIKLVTIMVLEKMKEDELKQFYIEVKNVLDSYNENPNIEYSKVKEAANYLCYNSGAILSDFMDKIIKYIENEKENKYHKFIPLKYLIEHRVILVLKSSEWVELFKVIETTIKYISKYNIKEYNNIINIYNKLKIAYFIIVTSENYDI